MSDVKLRRLDEFRWERDAGGHLPYYVHPHGGHVYSVSTVGTAIAVTPLYVLPAWWLAHAQVPYDDVRARVLEVVDDLVDAFLAIHGDFQRCW